MRQRQNSPSLGLSKLLNQSRIADQQFEESKLYYQGLSDKQYRGVLDQLERTKASIGVPELKEERELKDLFNVLKERPPQEHFLSDKLRVESVLKDLEKDGMKFLTHGELIKQRQLQDLLVNRKQMLQKEETFLGQVKELYEYYNVNRRIQIQKGQYNKDFENQKRERGLKLKFMKGQIDNDKRLWLGKFDQVKSGTAAYQGTPQNPYLKTRDRSNMNANELQVLRDKLSQDEQKIHSMKRSNLYSTSLEMEHPDIQEIMYEKDAQSQFMDQVKFVYSGTAISGSNKDKLDRLSALRERLEKYSMDNGLSKALVDLQFEQVEPGNSVPRRTALDSGSPEHHTLQSIEKLRKDYIQAGGSDTQYLDNLNRLERTYTQRLNVPSHSLDRYPTQRPNQGYLQLQRPDNRNFSLPRLDTSFTNPQVQMNTSSSIANIPANNQSVDLSAHPIYQYLPQSFKNDLSKILVENSNLKENPTLPLLNLSRSDTTLKPIAGNRLDTQSDEKMLEYLRYQEAELLLQMNRMHVGEPRYNAALMKFNQIQNMKGVVEQSVLQKKVRNVADEANEVAMKRQNAILKFQNNAVFQQQYTDGRVPVAYSALEGFMVRWDFVSNLPIGFAQVRVAFGIFRQGDDLYTYRNTEDHGTQYESYRSNKCLLLEKELVRDVEASPDSLIFIELWCFREQSANAEVLGVSRPEPEIIGWTLVKMFESDGSLLVGKYRLPFYPREFSPSRLLNGESLPYIGNQSLYLRIALPLDPVLDNASTIFVENEYLMPEMHLHRSGQTISLTGEQVSMKEKLYKATVSVDQRNANLTPSQGGMSVRNNSEEKRLDVSSFQMTTQATQQSEPAKARPKLNFIKKVATDQSVTNQSDTSKKSRFGFLNRKAPGVISSPASRQQSDEQVLIIKIKKLSFLITSDHKELKVKIGLFAGKQLFKDVSKAACLVFNQLLPTTFTDTQMEFDFYNEMKIDLGISQQLFTEADLDQSYVFFAFYRQQSVLFSWTIQKLLEKSALGGQYTLHTGTFKENLLDPPGQSPPFNEATMHKNNMMVEYVLMKSTDQQLNLNEYNKYIPIEGVSTKFDGRQEQRAKLELSRKSVKNIEWNTQINFQIFKVYNFPSKNDLSIRTALLHDRDLVQDVLERPCLHQSDLDAFDSANKSYYDTHYTTVFRLGLQYLVDSYNYDLASLNYFISFFKGGEVIGVVQFPVVKTKKHELEIGVHHLPLYKVNKTTGLQGAKTNMSIDVVIRESHLQVDDIESVPSYVKKDGNYFMPSDNPSDFDFSSARNSQQQKTKYHPVSIIVHRVANYTHPFGLRLSLWLAEDKSKYIARDKQVCELISIVHHNPELKVIYMNEQTAFMLPLEQMVNDHTYQVVCVLYQEGQEEVYGWFALNLLQKQALYETRLTSELFKPPVQGTPVDFKRVKKLGSKIDIEIQRGDVTGTLKVSQGIKKGQRKQNLVVTVNRIDNFSEKGAFILKMCIMQGSDFLKDRADSACAITTEEFQTQQGKKVLDFEGEKFMFDVSTDTLPSEEQHTLVIYLNKSDGSPCMWTYFDLLPGGNPLKGVVKKKMTQPPFQKPPFNQSKIKSSIAEITIEVQEQ